MDQAGVQNAHHHHRQVREMMQTIHLKPTEAAFKVAVIVAADRLKEEAANAFLKTLEEPPANSVLILLSTDAGRLIDTIVSRCLRLHFPGEDGAQIHSAHLEWLSAFSKTALAEKSLLGRYRLLGALLVRLVKMKEDIAKELGDKSPINKYDDLSATSARSGRKN